MKKLIIVLMVVAMASFLFVGCLPGVTPEPTPEPTPTPTPTVKTDTPYITNIGTISLSSALTQYAGTPPAVTGVGVAGAIIKVYIDGVQSGVGTTGTTGAFTAIPVTMVTLTEGVKKLYVTATVPGLAESDKSTEYTFTYDKTKPKLASAVGDSSAQTITVTFSEDVDMNLSTTTATFASSALNFANWTLNGATLTASDIFSKISDKVVRITSATTITLNTSYYIGCITVEDNAENAITTESVVTFTVIP